MIPWFKQKSARVCIEVQEPAGFVVVTCSDYDKEFDFMHTHDIGYKAHAKRKITPNLIKFMDVRLNGNNEVRLISLLDEEIHVDIMDV